MENRTLHPPIIRALRARRAVAFTLLLSGLLLLGPGCGDSGPGLADPYYREGPIKIEITRDDSPEFSWDGDLTVQSISVHQRDDAGNISRTLWGYAGIDQAPPIAYGEQLDGESLAVGGAPPVLQRGERYRVTVTRNGEESHADWIVP